MARIIKRYDLEGKKFKLILDVYWQHLKGNKLPYLSSNNIKLIVNNKSIWFGRDEYKEIIRSIKSIDQEVETLLNSHLCTTEAGEVHQVANTLYYLDKTRRDLFSKDGHIKTDLWTIDRFCEYVNINEATAKDWLFSVKNEGDMIKVLAPILEKNKKELDLLTEKYDIETRTK